MPAIADKSVIIIRSSLLSYVMLIGIWIFLAIGSIAFAVKIPHHGWEKSVALTGCVIVLLACWLRGFKITVTNTFLEYRDGLYKSSKIALLDIADIKHKSLKVHHQPHRIGPYQILIISKNSGSIITINTKPFKLIDIQKVLSVIDKRSL
jgi:hypothetical protein